MIRFEFNYQVYLYWVDDYEHVASNIIYLICKIKIIILNQDITILYMCVYNYT